MYDADGGLLGEAAYVWGKLRGTKHCGLCDITHSTVRRKGEWDRMVASLPVPVRLLHLNELDDELRARSSATRAHQWCWGATVRSGVSWSVPRARRDGGIGERARGRVRPSSMPPRWEADPR